MDQNKIIAGAAKATLAPLGLSRKGRSRLWYDDHGFWAVVVEFQPSGWDRGTYLNVGLTWLFNSDTWSFNIGYREGEFLAAEKSAAFEQGINQTAEKAAALVQNYRNTFSSLPKCMRTTKNYRGVTGTATTQEYLRDYSDGRCTHGCTLTKSSDIL